MALSISNAVDIGRFQGREARYLQLVAKYDRAEVNTFCRALAEVVLGLEAGAGDILGVVFGAMELGNASRGQFFTPYEVCKLMASTQFSGPELAKAIEARGYVTALEPACGSGAMAIAIADHMQETGFNPQEQLHVTAIDLDARAAHMAYVQLSLMHIPAVVIVGNSLTAEVRDKWHTPAHVIGGWHQRLAKEVTSQEQHSGCGTPCKPTVAVPVADEIMLPWSRRISPSDKAQLPLF